jgi:hypothetical protein
LVVLDVGRDVEALPTEQLEAEACTLAAQLAAATCRFLVLVGELERREAWRSWGCRSLAHWLSWQCGLGLVAARDHVRVAVALRGLPLVTAAFARGELSYSKVRALSRIAGMDERAEQELLEFARVATAAQVERTVAAYRGVVRTVARERGEPEPELPSARLVTNDDGTVTLSVTMTADVALDVVAALDAAQRHLRDTRDPAGSSRTAALAHVARAYLQPDAHAAPATKLVVHTDAALQTGMDVTGRIMLAVDAVRRLACEATIRRVRDTEHDLGRARRTVSRRLRRALVRRDGGQCRFPGCSYRHWLHAHHLWHWIDGGPTDLANLVLVCPFHHRLLHEGGWRIEGDPNRVLTFVSPQGRRLAEHTHPKQRAHWRTIPWRERRVRGSAIRTAHGENMDLDCAITGLCCLVPPDRN